MAVNEHVDAYIQWCGVCTQKGVSWKYTGTFSVGLCTVIVSTAVVVINGVWFCLVAWSPRHVEYDVMLHKYTTTRECMINTIIAEFDMFLRPQEVFVAFRIYVFSFLAVEIRVLLWA